MSGLVLPRSAVQSILERKRQLAFNVDLPEAKEFSKKLRKKFNEPEIQAGYVGNADIPGLVNHCWHIRRKPGVAPLPLIASDGTRLKLGNEIIRQLERWDTQSRAAAKALEPKEAKRQAALAIEKKDGDFREQRRDEVMANYRAISRLGRTDNLHKSVRGKRESA